MYNIFFLKYIYLFILGALTAFSLPPYNYFIINFFSLSFLFIFLFNKKDIYSKKTFFLLGWFFGFGFFFTSLYWVAISLTFDKDLKFLIPFSILLVPAFLAIFYGLITYFFKVYNSKKILNCFLFFSVIFGLVEMIRGYILTGFPWNLISYSFSSSLNFIQILSILGTYSFNLFCISLFTCPGIFFLKRGKKEIIFCFSIFIIAGTFLFYGFAKNKKFDSIEVKKNDYVIRAISSNISLERFYSKHNELEIIDELISLSKPNLSQPTIFLWPEGIVTDTSHEDIKVYEDLFIKNFNDNHLVIMGINTSNDEKTEYYNSLVVYDNHLNLVDKYNKIKLVPFGEFLPFENILKKVGLKTITNNYQSYSAGIKKNILNLKDDNFDLKLLPLICYEIIYSGEIFENNNFDFIINISEDGWFGNSIGPEQHFAHTIFRAIENGKYIIRSANNGISAIINPVGVIEKQIEYGKSGLIDLTENKVMEKVHFLKYGNKIFIFIILLYIFLLFSFNRFKND